jgi:hypothetical protein
MAPGPFQPAAPVAPEAVPSGKKSKRASIGLVAGVLVVACAVTAGIIFAIANSPENILAGAVNNLVSQSKTDVNLTYSAAADNDTFLRAANLSLQSDIEGKKFAAKGSLTAGTDVLKADIKFDSYFEGQDVYVKVEGVSEILGAAGNLGSMSSILTPIVDVIDGEWIHISSSDLKQDSSEEKDEATQCVENITKNAGLNAISKNVASDLYDKYKPLKITSESSVDGLSVFVVEPSSDEAVANYGKGVVKALTGVDIDAVAKCSTTTDIPEETEATDPGKVTVYIGGGLFDRQIKKVVVSYENGDEIVVTVGDGTAINFTKPENAKTLEDLSSLIQSAMIDGYLDMYVAQYEQMLGRPLTTAEIAQIREMLEAQMGSVSITEMIPSLV